ncbi:hypothetical protein B0H10DRAFT_2145856 [Mycena sp. CBHHK59/15]|nr:hypothetical protein B0H10DRAFT_2145856 [Mycena sp. CBHHK59/15]
MSTGEHKKRFWPLLLPAPCKGINENLDPPNCVWAAKDISYTLTKCSNLPEDANVRGYSLLSETELDVLDKWLALFLERFEVVGRMEIDTSEV